MKIAIAGDGKNLESEVSAVAGRARHFLIFENGELEKVISNPFRIGGGGASFAVAAMLADEGVELLVCGHFGEKMVTVLAEKNIAKRELPNLKIAEALRKIAE